MAGTSTGRRVVDNPDRQRYDIVVDGAPAGFLAYERQGRSVVLAHTVVDPSFEGKGVGGDLVRGVLDDIRARGDSIVPVCPFVRRWLTRHPEYADLDRRGAVGRSAD